MTFISTHPINSRVPTTSLRQPRELGHYSRNAHDEIFVNDNRNLNYYYFPDSELEKKYNLTTGLANFNDRNTTIKDTCSLEGLLNTIQQIESTKNKKINVNVITFRGIIRKLICAAFEDPKYNPINLRIVAFDGQIFIKEIAKPNDYNLTARDRELGHSIDRNSFTGYKFETITMIPKPLAYLTRGEMEGRDKKVVTNGDEYATVVGTGIGNIKIILGAEVDGIYDFEDTETSDNLKHYVELKCTSAINSLADCRKFENKIFRTWLQCFLVGIPRVIYGFRDYDYYLKSIEEYTTANIPHIFGAHNAELKYKFIECIKWYGSLMEWLTKTVPLNETCTMKPYRLVLQNDELKLSAISEGDPEYQSILENESILPTSFVEWRKSIHI